jgi:hypothetical protein
VPGTNENSYIACENITHRDTHKQHSPWRSYYSSRCHITQDPAIPSVGQRCMQDNHNGVVAWFMSVNKQAGGVARVRDPVFTPSPTPTHTHINKNKPRIQTETTHNSPATIRVKAKLNFMQSRSIGLRCRHLWTLSTNQVGKTCVILVTYPGKQRGSSYATYGCVFLCFLMKKESRLLNSDNFARFSNIYTYDFLLHLLTLGICSHLAQVFMEIRSNFREPEAETTNHLCPS